MYKNKKEQNVKSKITQKGITLVALVITIVILIILATITIQAAFGEGGLIQKAQQAKNLTEQATINEQDKLNSLMDEYANIMAEEPEVPDPEPVVNDVDPVPDPDPEPEPGDPIDGTLAVGPQVAEGMTPVKYINGIGWVKTIATDTEWYNYGEKKWANIVLGDATFNTSGNYEVLDEIKTYSMLVWIPRYAYKITSMYHQGGSGAGNIEIVFLDTANKDKDGDDYSSKKQYPSVSGNAMSDYVIHPAFTFGEEELAGFWVGKFETSNNGGKIQIKGGVQSWMNIEVSTIHTTCVGMNNVGNSYGLSTDDSVVDPHMMKNTEWGAVAYLSQSKYGKNSEVEINVNRNYYTGGGSETSYRSNQGQSTTGNVTGIYDMSGGAEEYVAAYNFEVINSHGLNLEKAPARYKNVYSTSASPMSGGYYGDAMYETSSSMYGYSPDSWNSDYSKGIDSEDPFLRRGGNCNGSSNSGLFAFYSDSGSGINGNSFRVVVPVL